jgi:hypothetical protein
MSMRDPVNPSAMRVAAVCPCAVAAALLAACVEPTEINEEPDLGTLGSELGNFPDLSPSRTQIVSALAGGCIGFQPGLPPGLAHLAKQLPCDTTTEQRFRFETMASGDFRIHSDLFPSWCLDVPFSNISSGQDLQFFDCHQGSNQSWTVNVVDATHATISPASNPALCLDIENASTGIANIQLFGCGSPPAANRLWRFRTLTGTRTGPACSGNITIAGVTLLPGQAGSIPVGSGNITGTCASVTLPTFSITCPTATNRVIAARNGISSFPISCFRE